MLQTAAALKKLLLEKSVRTGTFTLASGKQSDLYIDCRVTALDPFGAALIGDLGWHAVRSKIHSEHLKINAIGGMTLGADPISLAVGMASASQHPDEALQVFTVRKEPKGHGAGKQIEGNFKAGDTVIVVDDVITTGGSTLKAIDAIEAAFARFCAEARSERRTVMWYTGSGNVPLHAAFAAMATGCAGSFASGTASSFSCSKAGP